MQSRGNVASRKLYEQYAPLYYVRPTETDSPYALPTSFVATVWLCAVGNMSQRVFVAYRIVRENWIRAKYVRKEFMAREDKKGMRVCAVQRFEQELTIVLCCMWLRLQPLHYQNARGKVFAAPLERGRGNQR
jgi:hypothetical protein